MSLMASKHEVPSRPASNISLRSKDVAAWSPNGLRRLLRKLFTMRGSNAGSKSDAVDAESFVSSIVGDCFSLVVRAPCAAGDIGRLPPRSTNWTIPNGPHGTIVQSRHRTVLNDHAVRALIERARPSVSRGDEARAGLMFLSRWGLTLLGIASPFFTLRPLLRFLCWSKSAKADVALGVDVKRSLRGDHQVRHSSQGDRRDDPGTGIKASVDKIVSVGARTLGRFLLRRGRKRASDRAGLFEMSYRVLETLDGRRLRITPDRRLVAVREAETPRLILFCERDAKIGSLIAEDLALFTIQDVTYRSLSVAVDIFVSDDDIISLFIVSENRFLEIAGDDDDAPCCVGDRVKNGGSSLRGSLLHDVAYQMQSYATDFCSIYTRRFEPADLLRGAFIAALASCAPVLTEQAVASIWALLRNDAELLQKLVGHDPDDYWAAQVLSAHATDSRKSSDPVLIKTDLDWLGHDYTPLTGFLKPRTLGEILVYASRRALSASDEICVVATARNEGLYLVDWIAYNLAIGIQRIHIYSNDNDDGSDALLLALHRAGHISYVRSEVAEGQSAQAKAYGHAFRVNRSVIDSRWTLVCDLDEFFVFDTDRFRSIGDYLEWAARRHTDAITLSWGFVGPSHHVCWSPDHVIDRFQSFPHWGDNIIKSIFRTAIAGQSYAHFPIASSDRAPTFRNSIGDVRTSMKAETQHKIWGRSMDDEPVISMAFLCHYYFKSAEEFIIKHTRNRGDYPKQARVADLVLPPSQLRTFLTLFNRPDDRWPVGSPKRCAPDLHRICEMIRGDTDVAHAEAQVRSLYLQRRQQLVAGVVETPAFRELGDDARSMMELLGRPS